MALRLRRYITFSSFMLKHRPFSAIPSLSPLPKPSLLRPTTHGNPNREFLRSSFLSTSSRFNDNGDRKISPDEILFEGCDYNHWLITMDFPKDPKPTPEEMVETYVQTLAKVVGSVEEAKKRMYACSTTTYTGFQAVMTEEMSEKFKGLPGVVFILPDSYIDPVNKEYGGDKYINGTIIPRPPPVQYGRQGRYGDRNRISDRQRYDRPRDPMPMQQGNATYDRQGPMQGDGRNFVPQQNYGPIGQDGRNYGPPASRDFNPTMQGDGRNYVPQQNYGPRDPMPMQGDGRNYVPQQNYGPRDPMPMQGDGRNYVPQQNYGPTGQDGRNYGPPASGDFNPAMGRGDFGQGERRDYGQAGGRDSYAQGRRDPIPIGGRDYSPGGSDNFQVERRDSVPSYQRDYNQGDRGNYISPEERHFSQGERRDYAPPERRDFRGDFRDATHSSSVDYRQGMTSGYGQGNSGPNDRQAFSQVEQRDGMQGEQRSFSP